MKASLVVATLTMLVDIETFFLDSLINTETSNLLDTPEEDDTCYGCPKVDAEDTEALSTEESEATTTRKRYMIQDVTMLYVLLLCTN